ncbi:MAG: hypothetical protein IRZ32_08555 [Solirubrobacteraceae bacterium]|nr:hypothetical protein [Solirubrobacteraceae bacterium]
MHLPHRKGRWERRWGRHVAGPVKDALPKAVKPGLAALGGLVGLTAGSAAVSSLRRRGRSGPEPRGS